MIPLRNEIIVRQIKCRYLHIISVDDSEWEDDAVFTQCREENLSPRSILRQLHALLII